MMASSLTHGPADELAMDGNGLRDNLSQETNVIKKNENQLVDMNVGKGIYG